MLPSRSTPLQLDALLPGLQVLPICHGSLAFAQLTRECLLESKPEVVAIDLPDIVREEYVHAVESLPQLTAVTWKQAGKRWILPADPCDSLTVAVKFCQAERIALHFVDCEAPPQDAEEALLPDPAIAEILGASEISGLSLAALTTRITPEMEQRVAYMVAQLQHTRGKRVLLLMRMALVPALLRALVSPQPSNQVPDDPEPIQELELATLQSRHALFVLGEWPLIAQESQRILSSPWEELPSHWQWASRLYTWARRRVLSKHHSSRISVSDLQTALRFAQRMARLEHKQIPELWDLVQAAKACVNDAFAAAVLEAATHYGLNQPLEQDLPTLRVGPHLARCGSEEPYAWKHRLRPRPVAWTTLRLKREPTPQEAQQWMREWTNDSLCSHLPEDIAIERFHTEVRDRARSSQPGGQFLSRPFESSLLDGLDLRETVRNLWKGQLWVREAPPRELDFDATILLFDDERDREYEHRGTWYAEHMQESTLLFYATNPARDPIGPGILRSRYGGLGLLFPPKMVPDIYAMPTPPFGAVGCAETLVAGICLFSQKRAVAFASWAPPTLAMQAIAKRAGKRLIYVPLKSFSGQTIERLRTFHVLNGHKVRSWANRFIQGK